MSTEELVKSEVEDYAKFDIIRYAMCWEDADILLEALDINENDNILSISSAGENSLSMLIKNPRKVYAIDLNKNQIVCTNFKIACFKMLEYDECMKLLGVFKCENRLEIYEKIKKELSQETQEYFEKNIEYVKSGIINCGKFENYFKIFREKVIPIVHGRKAVDKLFENKSKDERIEFYNKKWSNIRWNLLFRIFFSRTVMGKLGRDKAFFRYVNVNVAEAILDRTKYAMTELNPYENSYLQFIFFGEFKTALPLVYRKENFEKIKKNIDKIEVLTESVETFIQKKDVKITKYNLSDIFEYMSEDQMCKIIEKMLESSPNGSKIAYWNMLSDKQASRNIDNLRLDEKLSDELFRKDKAFFYSRFLVEEICL